MLSDNRSSASCCLSKGCYQHPHRESHYRGRACTPGGWLRQGRSLSHPANLVPFDQSEPRRWRTEVERDESGAVSRWGWSFSERSCPGNTSRRAAAISPRGGWDNGGEWAPVPFIDNDAAERLFRAKVLSVLTDEGLLSDERARVLMTWSHNSGFSVDDGVRLQRHPRAQGHHQDPRTSRPQRDHARSRSAGRLTPLKAASP